MSASFASPELRETLLARAATMPAISITHEDVYRLRHLLTGYYSPLTDLVDSSAWHDHARRQVVQLTRFRAESDAALEIPQAPLAGLDVDPEIAAELSAGDSVALRDPEGVLMAIVELSGVGTENGSLYGSLLGVDDALPIDFAELQLTPADIRAWVDESGHEGFIAINASRLPDQRNLASLQTLSRPPGTPILYNLFVDARDLGFYRSRPWVAAHLRLVDRLPAGSRLNLVPVDTQLLSSGARTWVFAQFAHAGGAERILDECISEAEHEAGVTALRSGSRPRADIVSDACLPLLEDAFPPRHRQGFTVFFTGLSGSGKSTIANRVRTELLSRAARPVSMLDGDLVRQHLSSELGFSREHRIVNVLRIGYVASEITRHGGIAICAPIAPYQQMRREVRDMVSQYGGFIEVHVATSFEQCEQRDVKGLYARARAGLIKEFTGLDDPYEEPVNPEIRLETVHSTPAACATRVIAKLEALGYLTS